MPKQSLAKKVKNPNKRGKVTLDYEVHKEISDKKLVEWKAALKIVIETGGSKKEKTLLRNRISSLNHRVK